MVSFSADNLASFGGADDEVCHVLWEHNDLSIADLWERSTYRWICSESDLPIAESISIAMFLSLISLGVWFGQVKLGTKVCQVHSLTFVAAIMDRVCAWCRGGHGPLPAKWPEGFWGHFPDDAPDAIWFCRVGCGQAFPAIGLSFLSLSSKNHSVKKKTNKNWSIVFATKK